MFCVVGRRRVGFDELGGVMQQVGGVVLGCLELFGNGAMQRDHDLGERSSVGDGVEGCVREVAKLAMCCDQCADRGRVFLDRLEDVCVGVECGLLDGGDDRFGGRPGWC